MRLRLAIASSWNTGDNNTSSLQGIKYLRETFEFDLEETKNKNFGESASNDLLKTDTSLLEIESGIEPRKEL